MATEAVTPNISAPAAPPAAPASPAPSSAPATPAASPAAPATPVASEPIKPNQGERSVEFLQRVMKTKSEEAAAAEKAGGTDPEKKAEAGDPAPVVEPAKPAEAPKVEEPKKDEIKPEAAEEGDDFSLEPDSPLPTTELAKKFKDSPELAQALEKAGIDKNSLFATSRLAAKTAKYDQIFDGDLDAAEQAKVQATQFSELADLFMGSMDHDGTRQFLAKIASLDYQLDEEGNPVMNPATNMPFTHGNVGRLMNNILELALDYQGKQDSPRNVSREDLQAAVEVLKTEIGLSRGPGSAAEDNLTEAQKAEGQRLKTERESLDRTRQEETKRKSEEFEVKVATQIDSQVDSEIAKILTKTDLTDGQKKFVLTEIKNRVTEKIKANKLYFSKMDSLMRRPLGDKTSQARVAHGINSARPLIPEIARAVLKEQGVQIKARQEAAKAKSDAQSEAARSEVKLGGATPAPAKPMEARELNDLVRSELAKDKGREPTTAEMFQGIAEKKRKLGLR